MNRLPTLRARGAAAFEQAFARRMLRLRKTGELNATSCSNAPAGPIRSLLETGSRVGAFCQLCVEDISFAELEVRVRDKGGKTRDVPVLQSLANELRIHLGERRTGLVFPSPRGGPYSKRRLQQIVKELAAVAEIRKNVYPHLLRHTIAQRLADQGMPENLLQKFLGARESANDPGLLPAVPASSEASLPRGDGASRVMASWRRGSFRAEFFFARLS